MIEQESNQQQQQQQQNRQDSHVKLLFNILREMSNSDVVAGDDDFIINEPDACIKYP